LGIIAGEEQFIFVDNNALDPNMKKFYNDECTARVQEELNKLKKFTNDRNAFPCLDLKAVLSEHDKLKKALDDAKNEMNLK
jgi:hypothetical protein